MAKNRYQWFNSLGLKDVPTEDTVLRIVKQGKDHPDHERETHECLHEEERAVSRDGKLITMCIMCGKTIE